MINKDSLLDSYFMANDYKETDIETAIKDINEFIKTYDFEGAEIKRWDVMSYSYKNHDFLRIARNDKSQLILGLNNEIEFTSSYLTSFGDDAKTNIKKKNNK